jgi:hypothetical protein
MENFSPFLRQSFRINNPKIKKSNKPIIPVGVKIIEIIRRVIKKIIIVSMFLTKKLVSDKFEKNF